MIFSSHNPNNQLINTGNNAFYFLGKRVFLEKNNDAIKSFWTDVFFLRKRSRHRQRQRSCLPFKEWKKRKGFSLGLVKHVEFGARSVSNPRWFVCERYLLTSLLSYNWLSNKPAYSIQQCMAKQFARSIRSFDKFQEKEAFSGILSEGISQNIILRVFLKLQGTLKWINIIYIFSQA